MVEDYFAERPTVSVVPDMEIKKELEEVLAPLLFKHYKQGVPKAVVMRTFLTLILELRTPLKYTSLLLKAKFKKKVNED